MAMMPKFLEFYFQPARRTFAQDGTVCVRSKKAVQSDSGFYEVDAVLGALTFR
jgi:hypothetical protein